MEERKRWVIVSCQISASIARRVPSALLIGGSLFLGGCTSGGDGDRSGDGLGGSGPSGEECEDTSDCELPETVPEDCAEAECDQGVCVYSARDKDQDGFPSRRCTSRTPGVSVTTGNDCDDGDADVSPNGWDGPEGDGFEDGCNDDIDQDCDGLVDGDILESGESCQCEPGQTGVCSTTEVGFPLQFPELEEGKPLGACQLGSRECLPNGTWGQCTGAVGPTPETCDGQDNDCDGIPSEEDVEDLVDSVLFVCDGDNDGYVSAEGAQEIRACSEPTEDCGDGGTWVPNPLPGAYADCDDAQPVAFPGNIEACDFIDNNCNGKVDDNPPNATTWTYDADGDGFRTVESTVIQQCEKPTEAPEDCVGTCPVEAWTNSILTVGDCNDDDAQINPSARDACDGQDWDCDGSPLTGCACNEGDPPQNCDEHDEDGVGVCKAGTITCIKGSWSRCIGSVAPEDELCGTKDLDCDGSLGNVDDDAIDRTHYVCDGDGDGHLAVSGAIEVTGCQTPAVTCSGQWILDPQPGVFDDCDDTNDQRYPGKAESCDGLDNDCDVDIDEFAYDALVWSYDPDGDGFRDASVATKVQCNAPTTAPAGCTVCIDDASAWVERGAPISAGDCDESNPSINPSAVDQCNGVDANCDGSAVTGCSCTSTEARACGAHPGQDGLGICQAGTETCAGGSWAGCVGSVGPQAEHCGTTDYDCDGTSGNTDADAIDQVTFYCDEDQDGYLRTLGALSTSACGVSHIPVVVAATCPGQWVQSPPLSLFTDCDDEDDTAYPGRLEVCDGVDNDCDGATDTDAIDRITWSYDPDRDGFRDSTHATQVGCSSPSSAPSGCTGNCPSGTSAWSGSAGALPGGDCNNGSIAINPGAADRCDGTDYDCDGSAVTGCSCTTGDVQTCGEHDEDGTGVCQAGTQTCTAGAWGACVGAVGPTTEQCGSLDYDCDGTAGNEDADAAGKSTYTCDADGDGYVATSGATTTQACGAGFITVSCAGQWLAGPTTGTDCNDGNSQIYLGAAERCGSTDYDCDSVAGNTDADAIDRDTFVCDADADGRLDESGSPSTTTQCTSPVAGCAGDWVRNPASSYYDDCDDTDAEISPVGTYEVCDGKDNDCSGAADDESELKDRPVATGTSYMCDYVEGSQTWVVSGCPTDTDDCDSDYTNACETDLRDNPDDCGACNTSCYLACVDLACDDIVDVEVGGSHACGIRESGSVVCWGDNTYGQLGDGTLTASSEPVEVGVVSGVVALSLGLAHTCALRSDGIVYCWGNNESGQTGRTASTSPQTIPKTATSLTNVSAIAAGSNHTCAINGTGSLWCWGDNAWGQLGNGESTGGGSARAVLEVGESSGGSTVSDAVSVSAGEDFSCAVLTGKTVICWGLNSWRQLGDGSGAHGDSICNAAFTDCSRAPVAVSSLSNVEQVAAAVGGRHACARTSTSVSCWGYNADGRVTGTAGGVVTSPASVSVSANPAQLAAGETHTCARLTGGSVECWGSNSTGQLGRGSSPTVAAPGVGEVSLASATDIGCGDGFGCAVSSSGSSVCWGQDDSGQLGDGDPSTTVYTPTDVSRLAN